MDSAIEIIKRIKPNESGIRAVIHFAESLFDSGHADHARDLLHHALTMIQDMESSNLRGSTDRYLLNTLARYQLFSEFFHTLRGSTVDIFVNVIADNTPFL